MRSVKTIDTELAKQFPNTLILGRAEMNVADIETIIMFANGLDAKSRIGTPASGGYREFLVRFPGEDHPTVYTRKSLRKKLKEIRGIEEVATEDAKAEEAQTA